MTDFLTLLKAVYTKEKIYPSVDTGLCVALNTALSKQKDNLPALKEIVHFTFYVSPITYFWLLWLFIPAKPFIPKNMKFADKEDEKELSDELKEIQDFYGWTDKEFKIYRPFFELAPKTEKKTRIKKSV